MINKETGLKVENFEIQTVKYPKGMRPGEDCEFRAPYTCMHYRANLVAEDNPELKVAFAFPYFYNSSEDCSLQAKRLKVANALFVHFYERIAFTEGEAKKAFPEGYRKLKCTYIGCRHLSSLYRTYGAFKYLNWLTVLYNRNWDVKQPLPTWHRSYFDLYISVKISDEQLKSSFKEVQYSLMRKGYLSQHYPDIWEVQVGFNVQKAKLYEQIRKPDDYDIYFR